MPKRRKLNARHQKQQQQAFKSKSNKSKNQDHHQKLHDQPIIPFDRHDRILLVGEGNLSFAASLVRHHGCTNVVATVLEKSEAELLDKYPHAAENIAAFTSPPEPPPAAAAAKEAASPAGGSDDEQYGSGDEEEYDDEEKEDDEGDTEGRKKEEDAKEHHHPIRNKIIYNIDATKPLPASASRPPPKRIIFNFPHVGGKSTDVNRQVRHNQSLLVDFFTRAAIPALSASDPGRRGRGGGGGGGGGGGTVVVTLFEGEPYTLWNVRDLARHAGLQVERSFRFRWDAYPGYHHARTLGVVRSRKGGEEGGGGWKGEDRAARSYVFSKKWERPARGGSSRKRRRDDDDDED